MIDILSLSLAVGLIAALQAHFRRIDRNERAARFLEACNDRH